MYDEHAQRPFLMIVIGHFFLFLVTVVIHVRPACLYLDIDYDVYQNFCFNDRHNDFKWMNYSDGWTSS